MISLLLPTLAHLSFILNFIKMDLNDIEHIKALGFVGFKSILDLWEDSSYIPDLKGVYLVLQPVLKSPDFLSTGVGGFFKERNPNVEMQELVNNWVEDSRILYIGKATSLKKRIRQYIRFGQTKKVGHWGGRYIWQLKNHSDLLFCWQQTGDRIPDIVEKDLIDTYRSQFIRRPFANLAR